MILDKLNAFFLFLILNWLLACNAANTIKKIKDINILMPIIYEPIETRIVRY